MKVLCAPDKFRGTLSAPQAACAMARGVERAGHAADMCPIADGGEGTLEIVLAVAGGEVFEAEVAGPLGEPVTARWAMLEDRVAIIELAEASGLGKVPMRARDATRTTTFGTGELVRCAVEHGCIDVILFVGGSATVDGGAGAFQALGGRLFNHDGMMLEEHATGADLSGLSRAAPAPPLPCRLRVACDVRNPLLGPRGAAAVFGPQKGATPAQVSLLEESLRHWATLIGGNPDQPGTGAAGGIGFGLATLAGAELVEAAPIILRLIRFDERLESAHAVITGEGSLDSQTLEGKAVVAVASAAKRSRRPVIAVAGRVESAAMARLMGSSGGLDAVYSLESECGERAMSEPAECLAHTVEQALRRWPAAF